MTEISKINVNNVVYHIKDKVAREAIANAPTNAVTIEKGHSYTLACQDLSSGYAAEINARFIAGDKMYSKMRVVEPDWDNTYEYSLYYDNEIAYNGYEWVLSSEVVFIDSLTDDEKSLIDFLLMYEGTDNGEVDIFMCGDKFLGMANSESDEGLQYNAVGCYEYFNGNISTPLYEIPCFDGIPTEPGFYSVRIRHANKILANFIIVCNGDIPAGQSIYSTPGYCSELNKMVMLQLKHHQYIGGDDGDQYYEDHTLIHVIDMIAKSDITGELISLHAYDWIYDNYENMYGGVEYAKLG